MLPLIAGLNREIDRVRGLVRELEARDRVGLYASIHLRRRLDDAHQALERGDLVAIARAYAALVDCS